MRQTFEGFAPACQFAQEQSKKDNSEYYVLMSRTGGIKYHVLKPITVSGRDVNLQSGEKVKAIYKSGVQVK